MEIIIKGKRGFFFTFIAMFIIILIVAVVTTRNKFRYREKAFVISTRIRTMDNFITDMEDDLDRNLFIGGYRAILSLQKYIRMKEGFISDLDTIFAEIYLNGTANGTEINIMKQEGQGADFSSWLERINEESSKLNILIEFVPHQVSLTMNDPWRVLITLNLSFNIMDRKNLASWQYNKIFTKEIVILGFEDPLYTVYTDDKISNLIYFSNTTDFVNDITNDTTFLELHLNNSYYIPSTDGPSFLMRLTGNLSNSTYGIESLINLGDLQKQGLGVKNKTLVDYIYFGNKTTSDYCDIQGMPYWFRIDQGHEAVYEIDQLDRDPC